MINLLKVDLDSTRLLFVWSMTIRTESLTHELGWSFKRVKGVLKGLSTRDPHDILRWDRLFASRKTARTHNWKNLQNWNVQPRRPQRLDLKDVKGVKTSDDREQSSVSSCRRTSEIGNTFLSFYLRASANLYRKTYRNNEARASWAILRMSCSGG